MNQLDGEFIKPKATRKMISVFTAGDKPITSREARLNSVKKAHKEKYDVYPPAFGVISPTQSCNLHCTGCYATSDKTSRAQLEYWVTRRVIRETHDLFHSRFCTISGGEPLLYRSDGKTIFDLFEEFDDMFFLVYTNGTLINSEVAARLAELGNATPCISVEGFEKHTDERRGRGVHKKNLNAMTALRNEGIPYLFQFQMMPIGRGKELINLMITPKQRVELFTCGKNC